MKGLIKFIKTTVIGGLVVIIPLTIFAVVLGMLLDSLVAITSEIAEHLPNGPGRERPRRDTAISRRLDRIAPLADRIVVRCRIPGRSSEGRLDAHGLVHRLDSTQAID